MWILYVLGFFAIIFIIAILVGIHNNKVTIKANNAFEEKLLYEGFSADKKIFAEASALFIDSENKLLSIKEDNKSSVKIYKFSDLLGYATEGDDKSVVVHNKGGAVVGGLLFGVVGAAVGAGQGKIQERCSRLSINIKVNDVNAPIKTMVILNREIKKESAAYQDTIKTGGEMLAALSKIMGVEVATSAGELSPDFIKEPTPSQPLGQGTVQL